MDPVIDNEWLTCKNDPIDEAQNLGNIARSWQWRELGINPPHYPPNKTVLENIAEDVLVQKPLKIRCCDLPGYPRSTFLMVFSPDGTKVASTHGNHNVYVSELASGKHVRILKGHPRTPWCIAFHPSHPQLIGSGCLGGQVRVWDISSGGSEVWNVRNETVIASIAFHPREQLLVIATYNELYFWDWSQPAPFTRVSTNNVNEKVRYVAFDALGYKLITGISLWTSTGASNHPILQQNPMGPTTNQSSTRRDDADDNSGGNRPQENSGTAQDMIVNSYQNLVQRYDSLVRNYQRLFMVRHRLTNTPPPPNTIDRGTDPMETDVSPGSSGWTRNARPSASTTPYDDATPGPSTSRRQDAGDSGDADGSSSRLLNLDVLSFDSSPSRNQDSPQQEHSIFGSRPSAFQPLTEGRIFRTVDQNERSTRLLPNPFSTSNTNRSTFSDTPSDNTSNTSRTSIFTPSRAEAILGRDFLQRRRNSSPSQHNTTRNANALSSTNDAAPSTSRHGLSTDPHPPSPNQSVPSTSGTSTTQRPTMTNSATQMSPVSGPVDAQTINESLDLIRDILRDSGTRLLNLITNMSLSTLASVERSMPRRGSGSRAQSDDSEGGSRPRGARPRVRLFSSSLRRDLLSSSSDSDSDHSLEVNIFRTRNSTYREDETRDANRSTFTTSSDRQANLTDRMVFELNDESQNEGTSRNTGGINVTLSNDRFRVRTQNSGSNETGSASVRDEAGGSSTRDDTGSSTRNEAGSSTRDEAGSSTRDEAGSSTRDVAGGSTRDEAPTSESRPETASDFNPNRPSTSRDNFWTRGNVIPPEEAYRKVKGGVNALQKHTMQLTNLWLRGNRTTMRELRNMWENLRRRILMLHRETGRQDLPSYYTRSLLERCMMLTDMTDNVSRTSRSARNIARSQVNDRSTEDNRDTTGTAESNSNSTPTDNDNMNTSNESVSDRPPPHGRSPMARSTTSIRSSPSLRRRLQSSYRWRPEDEMRRRSRNPTSNRLTPRYTNRSRRDFARAIEISATRHEIRMRAMQVLSVMFNMMMMCLEERGLSQLIINMLRTLKKALALTCLMLMMNRNNGRSSNNPAPPAQRVESLNVVRIQNVDHSGPVNVDGPDDPASPSNFVARPNETDNSNLKKKNDENTSTPRNDTPSTSQSTATETNVQQESPVISPITAAQRWSNRLAVQIAAANRNYSATATNRRDLYLESRRQKALHRTNPVAHPLIRKRVLPPVSTHRIPALRSFPTRLNVPRLSTPRIEPRNDEPVAGPSTAAVAPSRDDMLNEFEHRVNLIRLAHLQAVRLRNAARTRFRRLQTIRLYTPSSVREMFALQTYSGDNTPWNRSPLQNGPEVENRRSFATYRPHILTPRSDAGSRPPEEPGHFHTVLNNVAMPLMQVNDLPATAEAQESQPQRLSRIHEYLQPIILAQNSMVVDEDGNGGEGGGGARRISAGMAGLLDAGIISETLPAPSNRVQAWDFTTGNTPDIADSTKNVVVQRCRIHNDASIDISKDGRLLVALLPVPRLRNSNHWLDAIEWGNVMKRDVRSIHLNSVLVLNIFFAVVSSVSDVTLMTENSTLLQWPAKEASMDERENVGRGEAEAHIRVYSLEWARLGQCLHTAVLEQSAVSVALSPTARHLAVGLGSRRFTTTPHARNNVFALLYRLEPLESSSRTGLSPIKELEQHWEHGFTSLNCLRWAPQPGQGLFYANNTGQLIIMS